MCLCTTLLLLAGGCGVTLRGVGDGVWGVTAWAVEGTGKVVKAVAVTTIDVTGAVAKKTIGEGADAAKTAQRADVAIVPGQPVSMLPVPRLSVR